MHDTGQIQTEYEAIAFEADMEEGPEAPEQTFEGEQEAVFSEEEEMTLAAEMLEIQDEAQLDEFLGKLVRRATRAVKGFVASPVGKHLVGILRGAAKRALPIVGTAVGGAFGGPAGAALGGKLATGAGQLFGLELEGLSPEDQEYEVARRYVRFAGTAARNTAAAGGSAPPAAATTGAVAAARRHAPGYLRGRRPVGAGGPHDPRHRGCSCKAQGGRWFRRGRYIVLAT